MLRLSSYILIEGEQKWEFSSVHNVSIVEDTDTLTDTCELQLPKKTVWKGYKSAEGRPLPIKRGDKITVKLGYDDELVTRFVGFVRSVDVKVPITIKCEDGMFLLKLKKAEPKSWKKASLKDVLQHLLKDTDIEFQLIDNDIELGSYRIVKPFVSEELQELREKYMLSSYFRMIDGKNVLYVGLKYPLDNRKKHVFRHGKNIISEDLEYRNKDDIRVRVQAESFGAKHKKTTIEIGDKDGDLVKIRIDGLSEEELKKYAERVLENYKKDGFKGSFETFGVPEVSKCDMVEVHASDGNNGTYLVKKNEITFGLGGYRQRIELANSVQ